ncbi:hypothetical protein GE061_003365 [Apolygus lucorum]|uniref:C2H2-type domain-containing protein n=1 Tax=Apolygus lucorum TaxID=248454 RepID=A0A8S9X1U5_APOLU|nr:hypothetical protein GE061_003365 [Apolygus lucorum]
MRNTNQHPLRPYPCGICGKRYKHKANRNNHMRHECGKVPKFSCTSCDYKSHLSANVKRHFVSKHGSFCSKRRYWRYPCDQCGRSYKHKSHLNSHIRYECGKEPQFACDFCPYKSKQKSHLKQHMFRHITLNAAMEKLVSKNSSKKSKK